MTTGGLKGQSGGNMYVMNVGLDLRLVDTKTLEVVDVISYQKQIIGREISAGVFDIFGKNIINVGAGDSGMEPIQLAVRSVVERAVLEMVWRLYQAGPDVCNNGPDPLGEARSSPPALKTRSAEVPAIPAPAPVMPVQTPAPAPEASRIDVGVTLNTPVNPS